MGLTENAVYREDALVLLDGLEDAVVDLIFLDPLWIGGENSPPSPTAVAEHARSLCRVFEQAHRVLAPTGTLFYLADPGLSGQMRVLLDRIFGDGNFRAEFIWTPAGGRSRAQSRRQPEKLLWYARTERGTENEVFRPLRQRDVRAFSAQSDARGPYRLVDLTMPYARPNLVFPWRGHLPGSGRSWRFSAERLEALLAEGAVFLPEAGGRPKLKQYLADAKRRGAPIGVIWDDIAALRPSPTDIPGQLPLELAERIVQLGSNPDGLVLDPFTGSGVMLEAAARHRRRWIGGDHNPQAVAVTRQRLQAIGACVPTRPPAPPVTGGGSPAVRPPRHQDPELAHLVDALFPSGPRHRFVEGAVVAMEEGLVHEFKRVPHTKPLAWMQEKAEEYAVAYLNAGSPGHLWFGIGDDGTVLGVRLSRAERDAVQSEVMNRLAGIQPPLSPGAFRLRLHPVHGAAGVIADLHVVELAVPAVRSQSLFYTSGNVAFLKYAGGHRKLAGLALQAEILRRFGH